MTKKNVFHLVDVIFWLLIAVFPIAAYLIVYAGKGEVVTFTNFLTSLGFGLNTSSPIYITLNAIFGVGGGMLELVTDTAVLLYATYFITIMLLHFIIDCLLIIVRWGHKLLDKATE